MARRSPLNHHGADRLISGIFLPERDVGPVRKADLEGPVIIDLRGRENSRLCVVIESVNERVARHQIVRRELRFNVWLGNDTPDSDVQSLANLREIEIDVCRRHIEAVVIVILQQLVAEELARNHEAVVETVDRGDAEAPVESSRLVHDVFVEVLTFQEKHSQP